MIIRILLFLTLLSPALFLAFNIIIVEVLEPVKYIYTFTGACSIILLFSTTLLSLIKNKINLLKYRRMIGLYTFFYAFIHFLNFFVFDAQFDLNFVVKESLDKPFIYLGMISLFILGFMAVTSFKSLYKKYYIYHRFIYLVMILVTIHFVNAQKALSIEQWVYLLIFIFIMAFKMNQQKSLLIKR